jgi:upstream activation factor subunit UAF30
MTATAQHEGEYTEAYTNSIAGGGGNKAPNQKKTAHQKKTATRRSSKRKVRIDQGQSEHSNSPVKKIKRTNPLMKIKYRLSKPLRRVLEDTDFKDQRSLSRPEVVKGLWQHIKSNDLQISVNGKRDHIQVSGPLKRIFTNHKSIQMFAMNKELSKHLERV